jgi:putative FmdB family regulatory protein
MPTYEYACDSCYTIYQTRHGINDPRPETCPECKTALRKVLSAPSLNTRRFTSPTEAKYATKSPRKPSGRRSTRPSGSRPR